MKMNRNTPLRLLLVTNGETIPNWLFKCIGELEQSRAAKFVLVLQAAHEEDRGSFGFVQHLRHFLFFLYKHLDRYLFRNFLDALAPIDLQSGLPNCRVLNGADGRHALVESQRGNTLLARTLQEEQIDVVLDPFALMPNGFLDELPKYGVWSTTFGQSDDPRTQSIPGFWELIEGRPTTEAGL